MRMFSGKFAYANSFHHPRRLCFSASPCTRPCNHVGQNLHNNCRGNKRQKVDFNVCFHLPTGIRFSHVFHARVSLSLRGLQRSTEAAYRFHLKSERDYSLWWDFGNLLLTLARIRRLPRILFLEFCWLVKPSSHLNYVKTLSNFYPLSLINDCKNSPKILLNNKTVKVFHCLVRQVEFNWTSNQGQSRFADISSTLLDGEGLDKFLRNF